jgi:beta-glucosidase
VNRKPETLHFPANFLWGAATAAHQVEGGLDNEWSEFERRPGAIKGGDQSTAGVDHYNRFDGDFALAEAMGHNAHRLSIEWSRIEPERGSWNMAEVAHYHEVFASLRKRGLEPFVTLHHFTNPRWLAARGGWLNAEAGEDFARFAAFAAKEFRHEVRYWITVNEPNIYAWHSYVTGQWPPRKRSLGGAFRVMANLGHAHVAAYRAIHETYAEDPRASRPEVGYSQNLMTLSPYADWSPVDRWIARYGDRVFNESFLDVVAARHGALDFIGVNYYTRAHIRFPALVLALTGAPVNDLGWEIYPEGLHQALILAGRYARLPDGRKIPVYVTENGICDATGDRRGEYLVSHLREVHRAIRDGVDVRGYIHWTLMDNFEWAEGYSPRFGLFYIDRERDLARVETPAVNVYRSIIARNAVDTF